MFKITRPPAGVRRRDREALQPRAAAQSRSRGPHFGGGAAAPGGHRGLLLLEGERQSRKSGGARGGRGPWITRVSPTRGPQRTFPSLAHLNEDILNSLLHFTGSPEIITL